MNNCTEAPRFIGYDELSSKLNWVKAVEALRAGHLRPKAQVGDIFLGPADTTMLSRGAYIEGLGYGLKSVTVFPQNASIGFPTVQGAMLMFEPSNGGLSAVIDSRLITEFKTAADSVLGATLLARDDSETLLIVGSGTVARSLVKAYTAVFPSLNEILIWSRRPEQSKALAAEFKANKVSVSACTELSTACSKADIISTATMAHEPILKGEWVKLGTHVDLIGAFKADMREADDALLRKGRLFVDSRETTIAHIGELKIPIANGVITTDDVLGDFYDLIQYQNGGRQSAEEITVFKNGGGAHLDLMMANYIVSSYQ